MGWVISQAIEWKDYSIYFRERGRDFQESEEDVHFLAFYGQPQNCHGACEYVIQHMLIYHNEHIKRLKVYRKFMWYPQQLCHSFKGCILHASLLFHSQLCNSKLIIWSFGRGFVLPKSLATFLFCLNKLEFATVACN